MSLLAVIAIGADRPGIVAAVTGVLYEKGCNLEDTSMTILQGHFTMMLVVSAPLPAADLEQALTDVAAAFDLVVAVRDIAPEPPEPEPLHPFVVSVYGADQPGIVHRVAQLLAEHGVNITDLSTRLLGDDLYVMLMEIDVPGDDSALQAGLEALGSELGVDATLRAADPDIL